MVVRRLPGGRRGPAARVVLVSSVAVVAASMGVAGCAGPASPPRPAALAGVGFLGSVSSHAPEASDARLVLQHRQDRANLLVTIVAADGPDSPAVQQVVLSDNRRHAWTLRSRHVVFGSIIDVFTAPGTGHEGGTVVSSHLTTHRGDEGQALTVAAYANGHYYDETHINGSGGIPGLDQKMPPGVDTFTVFVDGRQSQRIRLLPGEHPVNVYAVAGTDHDLYQISHTDSHGFEGGVMHTGNAGPIASSHWGLLNVNILPARSR